MLLHDILITAKLKKKAFSAQGRKEEIAKVNTVSPKPDEL